jgi:hypothetical protein
LPCWAPAASWAPAFNPFIFDPNEKKDDIAKMLSPQLELPAFAKQAELLKALDNRLRRQDGVDPLIAGLDAYQQTAFDMLRSPKLREAVDLSKEDPKTIERYPRASAARSIICWESTPTRRWKR